MMGEREDECGAVQIFASTRNVIGFYPVRSSFVATVTGHFLHRQHTRLRQRRHNLINDSTHHPSGHSNTQSHVDLKGMFSLASAFRGIHVARENPLGTCTVTNALPIPVHVACTGQGEGMGIGISQAVWFYAARVENHYFGTTCVQPHTVSPHNPLPPAPSPTFSFWSEGFLPPRRKAKETPGTEVADVIFLVWAYHFLSVKLIPGKSWKNLKIIAQAAVSPQCWLNSLASQADLMLLFLLGPFFSPTSPPSPTSRIGCHTFHLCGFLYGTGPQRGKFGAGSEILLLGTVRARGK